MLNRAVLALAYDSRADENDRKDCDVVDHPHACRELLRFKVLVEQGTNYRFNRDRGTQTPLLQKACRLTDDNFLDISRPKGSLAHRCRIDIDLDRGATARKEISFQLRWQFQNERILSLVQ